MKHNRPFVLGHRPPSGGYEMDGGGLSVVHQCQSCEIISAPIDQPEMVQCLSCGGEIKVLEDKAFWIQPEFEGAWYKSWAKVKGYWKFESELNRERIERENQLSVFGSKVDADEH